MSVGGREVVFTASLLVLAGEDAGIEFDAVGLHWRYHLEFTLDADVSLPGSLGIRDGGGFGILTARNLRNTFGTCSISPLIVGRTADGHAIFLTFWHMLTGTANRIELQFMSGRAP